MSESPYAILSLDHPALVISSDVPAQALALFEERYPDFGPTLTHGKLTEAHRLTLSVETVR